MFNGLFDPIINSEDEMIARAGIKRYQACAYLRAHIMASLCFEPYLVVSDSAVNLNRAFRTLIDSHEGKGYYKEDLVNADFEWLIREGHIRFAARNDSDGNFSETLRKTQKSKKNVDHPSKKYTKMIDEVCSDTMVYWYSIEEISKRFTSKFKSCIRHKLDSDAIPLEWESLFRELINRLSDKETIKYSDVKDILLEKHNEEDAEYQYVRKILRQSYDYNVPELLGLDYCMPLEGINLSHNKEWMLKASIDLSLSQELLCNVYGLSVIPVTSLKYIWESSEYENFRRQLDCFRTDGIEHLDEYVESLENYIWKINDVVSDFYSVKQGYYPQYEKGKLSSIPVKTRLYLANDTSAIIANCVNDTMNILSLTSVSSIFKAVLSKVLPVLAKKRSHLPEPPDEVKQAIILQSKTEEDVRSDSL